MFFVTLISLGKGSEAVPRRRLWAQLADFESTYLKFATRPDGGFHGIQQMFTAKYSNLFVHSAEISREKIRQISIEFCGIAELRSFIQVHRLTTYDLSAHL